MPIQEVGPKEANEIRKQESTAILLDVRTVEEFEQGHPDGALNIPVVLPSPMGMQPNPEFLDVVSANVPKDVKVLASCQVGQRSMFACQIMEQAGWKDLTNVRAGFGGLRDMENNVIEPGWAQLGLPVSRGKPDNCSYEELKAKAKAEGDDIG